MYKYREKEKERSSNVKEPSASVKRVTIKETPEKEEPLSGVEKKDFVRECTPAKEKVLQRPSVERKILEPTRSPSPATALTSFTFTRKSLSPGLESISGRYVNWNSQHGELLNMPWCCIGDLITFLDKYEYKTLSLTDVKVHNAILAEVHSLLAPGQAPFHMRKRFPGSIHNPENLWVCIGRCPSVEYHLGRVLNVFRRPLVQLSTDKQRAARQNFHLAINELRLDISARITDVRLYDRYVFERDFHLNWEEGRV